jgi:hypothetical protein
VRLSGIAAMCGSVAVCGRVSGVRQGAAVCGAAAISRPCLLFPDPNCDCMCDSCRTFQAKDGVLPSELVSIPIHYCSNYCSTVGTIIVTIVYTDLITVRIGKYCRRPIITDYCIWLAYQVSLYDAV